MKNIMDIAREIKGLDYDTAHKEIFDLIKADKTWIAEIVNMHIDEIIGDVLTIKTIVHDYHNPVEVEEILPDNEKK